MGSHTPGYNHASVSVCLMGGVSEDFIPEDNFTKAQYETLQYIIAMCRKEWPDIQVVRREDIQKRRGDSKSALCPDYLDLLAEGALTAYPNARKATEAIVLKPPRPKPAPGINPLKEAPSEQDQDTNAASQGQELDPSSSVSP